MRNKISLLLVGVVAVLLAGTRVWAGTSMGSGICPSGYNSTFNANGVGCTFCFNPDPNECDVECLGSPLCLCAPENLDECCAETPCCSGCPNAGSLECNVASCECNPETCCQTICPVAPSPVLGSPISPAFGVVAAALACSGAFLLMRQRKRRQRRQVPI